MKLLLAINSMHEAAYCSVVVELRREAWAHKDGINLQPVYMYIYTLLDKLVQCSIDNIYMYMYQYVK